MIRIASGAALLLLAACNVQESDNGATTVSFDANAAANGAEVVGNHAQNIGGHIVNDVKETGDLVQNKAGNVDVDVNLGGNDAASANAAAANQN